MVETLEIAKHDEKGRRLADAGEREALIAAYETSGMTQTAFAQKEGINRFTFAGWRKGSGGLAGEKGGGGPQRFVEVSPLRGAASFGLEVVLADGLGIRGSDCRQVLGGARGLRR